MKRAWLGAVLLCLPMAAMAQTGPVLRDSVPPDQRAAPQDSDDAVTATPLPPPDPDAPPTEGADAQPQMVPNPLDQPQQQGDQPATDTAAAQPGQSTQPRGQPVRGGWIQMGTATLQALDKVNAREKTLTVKVGETAKFGSLDIAVRGCYVRPADQPADATALLVIRDEHDDKPAFSGWMVHSAPYMSMMANAIYDVRVAGCST